MLYLLKRTQAPHYDEYDSKLVRADTEKEARDLANQSPGDEGRIWDDPSKVNCEIVSIHGKPEVVIDSFNAG